jgi:hypothetical protein
MRRWPTSRWAQMGIVSLGAFAASLSVFIWTNNAHFKSYAQQYPHDGQDGLGALMDACFAGVWTFVGVLMGLFLLQRMIVSNGKWRLK